MDVSLYTAELIALMALTLRIAPVFAFGPPFTLMRIPMSLRVLLAMSLALWLIMSFPQWTSERVYDVPSILGLFATELFIGGVMAMCLQLAFAAMLVAGRSIDIQAGFGLALLVDPSNGGQMPLAGTLFVFTAGAIFFAVDAPSDLLAIWAASTEALPLGTTMMSPDLEALLVYISSVFLIAIGLAGVVLLALFLVDISVAFISRTLPQMNVLLIGFQVKTLVVLATLPMAIAFSSGIFLKLIRLAIDAPRHVLW